MCSLYFTIASGQGTSRDVPSFSLQLTFEMGAFGSVLADKTLTGFPPFFLAKLRLKPFLSATVYTGHVAT